MSVSVLDDVCHGWYSQSAVDAGCGTAIYRDDAGVEYEVTEAVLIKHAVCFQRADAVYLGIVGKFVRVGKPSLHTGTWMRVNPI